MILMKDTITLVNPVPFDRMALKEALIARMEAMEMEQRRPYATPAAMFQAKSATTVGWGPSESTTKLSSSQRFTNEQLNKVFKGVVPREPCSGVKPKHLGGYKQIAPGGAAYEKALKLKRQCLMSHRKK